MPKFYHHTEPKTDTHVDEDDMWIIRGLYAVGQPIRAVKYVRTKYAGRLYAAKALAEAVRDQHGESTPEPEAKPTTLGELLRAKLSTPTVEKLQQHLATPRSRRSGFEYKEQALKVECADGTTLSVQASRTHYCTPRDNVGPYTEVEVWLCSADPSEFFDYDNNDPSAYVPIGKVAAFIDAHGGFAT